MEKELMQEMPEEEASGDEPDILAEEKTAGAAQTAEHDTAGEDVDSSDEKSIGISEKESTGEISDEELDYIADTAIGILKDILQFFDAGEVTIDEYEGDEGELILDITGDNLALLIGRHGRNLEALQYIVSTVTTRTIGYRYPVIVDIEGYKSRQREKLEAIARSFANKAHTQKRSMKLRPMSPYERRIVHIALRDDERVETASEGEGSARHVVIFPA